jgi:hypothetical protein
VNQFRYLGDVAVEYPERVRIGQHQAGDVFVNLGAQVGDGTIGEPRGLHYRGERWFPLVLQNVHRYFAYLAVVFVGLLSYDTWLGMWFPNATTGASEFGIGVGTVVMAVNVILIAGYTFGCHSLRHLFGGRKDEISKSPISQACYNCSSGLNKRHMLFAWCSLFSVGLTDVYIRLCSMGVLTDMRLL